MSVLDELAQVDAALEALDRAAMEVESASCVGVARLRRPRLRIYRELVCVQEGEGYREDFGEQTLSVIALSFEYDGFVVRASDPRSRVFCGGGLSMVSLERDAQAELHARYTLEGFGAVEIAVLEDYGLSPDSQADYLVHMDRTASTQCAFIAYAVPQLLALGFHVNIDEDYPYQVIETSPPWYAVLVEEDEKPDWFNLELGIEIEGHRVNLLPVLLDMLESGAQLDFSSLQSKAPRFINVPSMGRYLAVKPDRFATLMRVVAELYQGGGDGERMSFPAVRSSSLTALEQVLGGDGSGRRIEAADRISKRLQAHTTESKQLVTTPGLQAELRPYQEDGLRFLQRLRAQEAGGILADDMGLGKTLQTIAHLCAELASGRMDKPSLVVAPTSLVGNWRRELEKFAPHLRVCVLHGSDRASRHFQVAGSHVVITTYPVVVRDNAYFESQSFYYLILDEAQTVKNPRSRSAQAVRALQSVYRLCLSGTPIENNLDELWSQFDFLMPGLLGDELQFRHFYRHPIELDRDELRMVALRQQVAPFILRRMKDQVAKDLPTKTELVRPIELVGKQRDLYESIRVAAHGQVRAAIRKSGVAASTLTILDALMRLRQLCCDPRLVRGEAARFVRESAKYELLFRLVPQQLAEGRRLLIFSQFTSMLSLIAAGLRERDIGFVSLTGATQDRDRQVREFEDRKVDVFLISLKAGGTGLNLVSADTVIHYDPWWNPAAQDQATDRAYRIGQTKPVFVYNLIAAGSVEERMLALQHSKRRLAQAVMGGAGGASVRFDEREVEHLLSPLDE